MLVCDFCGRNNKDVEKMLQKDNGRLAICEKCIDAAYEALHPVESIKEEDVYEPAIVPGHTTFEE